MIGLTWILIAALLALPELSEAQRAQLETATDETRQLDEGALYPLLNNVRQWEPGDRRGAQVPDYQAIRNDPDAARGELFLIEGQFIGTTPRYRLTRAGPWGEALTGWGVVVDPEPPAAIVYFVDPEGTLMDNTPRYGAQVELVGRFYKVWTDEDAEGRAWPYLTFVARSAEVVRGSDTHGGPGGGAIFVVMLLLLGSLLFVLWRVRRMIRRPVTRRSRRGPSPYEMDELAETDESLPNDPEAALAELARRNSESDHR